MLHLLVRPRPARYWDNGSSTTQSTRGNQIYWTFWSSLSTFAYCGDTCGDTSIDMQYNHCPAWPLFPCITYKDTCRDTCKDTCRDTCKDTCRDTCKDTHMTCHDPTVITMPSLYPAWPPCPWTVTPWPWPPPSCLRSSTLVSPVHTYRSPQTQWEFHIFLTANADRRAVSFTLAE